jgi:hypothetical protein
MAQINQLSIMTTLNNGDLFVVYPQNQGSAYAISAYNLGEYVLSLLPTGNGTIKQFYAPTATGWSVQINTQLPTIPAGSNAWLVLTPTATTAAGTIVLPPAAQASDQQEIIVTSTQVVTALTITPNGATAVIGAPTALTAGGYFRLRFEAVTQTWYRSG